MTICHNAATLRERADGPLTELGIENDAKTRAPSTCVVMGGRLALAGKAEPRGIHLPQPI